MRWRASTQADDLSQMKLLKYLANLGYGSRREVEWLLRTRRVTRADGTVLSDGDSTAHDEIRVEGLPLDPPAGSVIMLHKPVGYVCSTTDVNPTVYALLPDRFRLRSPIMSPVGRLDRDTSGLLLITDDGALNHRVTSPRRHLPRCYEATLASALAGGEPALFASGTLLLDGESAPLQPARLDVLDAPVNRRVRLTIGEGRYHQVRRMFAAAGNHVETLHRTGIGGLGLGDLPPGAWRLLDVRDLEALFAAPLSPGASGPAAP